MSRGKVKWFSNTKGYGFIQTAELPDKDIFVHYSAIKQDGYRSLSEGDDVEFELVVGPKGPKAENVLKPGAAVPPDAAAEQAPPAAVV
jgi:CspA family cold shock protein